MNIEEICFCPYLSMQKCCLALINLLTLQMLLIGEHWRCVFVAALCSRFLFPPERNLIGSVSIQSAEKDSDESFTRLET